MATDSDQNSSPTAQSVEYAGFWARFAAFLVDSAILFLLLLAIGIASTVAGAAAMLIGQIVVSLVCLLYWPVMESSSRRATFGKSLVGIQVTDLDGARVSFLRSLLRNIAKIVSAFPLYIGFVLAAFTKRKQALHDMITKCLVVRTGPSHFVKALAAAVGGLLVAAGCGAAYFYYVIVPQMQDQVAGTMSETKKGAPPAKSASAAPPAAKVPRPAPAAPAVDSAPKPQGTDAEFDALAQPALTGLEKPGTTRAGPAILELSTFFPTSVWVRLHLPSIKDLDIARPPEITVTSVLDASGQNYHDAASDFEKSFFTRVNLGGDTTPVPHLSGLRTVQTKPGLNEKALQKIEGQVRITLPVDARPLAFEAGDTGKEKAVHGAAVSLKSLSGATAVVHYRGPSSSMLGVRGYGKDGAPVAVESRSLPPANQVVDMDLQVKFKAPAIKVEAIVAAKLVERQFPFTLARGAVAGPPAAATIAAKPPEAAPAAPSAVSATPKPAGATPPVAAAAAPEPAKAAPAVKTVAPAKSVAATPPTAQVAATDGEPKARPPRRRITPAKALAAPVPAVAPAPSVEPAPISPKYNDVMTAVLYGDEAGVRQLLDLGRWVDKRSSIGYTPLMAAVMNRDARIVQLLLERGADPNAAGPGGTTALGLARDRNDSASAALLERRGAR